MNILPKKITDFASKAYWDKFFQKRKESFEWYGDYEDIKPILLSYLKPDDSLLVIGCGNSTLSVDLFDDGYYNNVSIDISEIVINKMISKYKNDGVRKKLTFECMDMFQMTYPDESFNIVLDKGTLDAVSSDDINISKMFFEISRVLKYFGRYICVTLLQEHVLDKLLSWFLKTNNWICRIHRCFVKKDQNDVDIVNFPVFIVTCIKLKTKLPESYIELKMSDEKNFQKYRDTSEVFSIIKSSQNIEFLKYFIRNNMIDDCDFYIELFDETNISESRYMLYFLQKSYIVSNIRCSVFIVPQGREHEWMFSTAKGREQLMKQCCSDRMVVVLLNRKHHYESMESIKNDLSKPITDFFPVNSGKILFLSIDDDIGQRNLLWEGTSDINGQMFVEDVTIDNVLYRRLVFSKNCNIIQSEARLKLIDTNQKREYLIENQLLSCNHHQFIAAGLALLNRPYKNSYSLLMIGLGGGCFVNFLAHNLKSYITLKVIVVEIDPVIEEVAKKYFDFGKHTQKNVIVKVVIQDGLKYIANMARSKEKCDFIVFDVDSKNLNLGISCPPKQFVEEECLNQIESCLTSNGIFILNFVARDEDIKREVYNRLKMLFLHCFYCKVENDLNEIIFSSNAEQLEWLKMKDSNRRYDYISRSCFNIELLEQTYRQLCRKIRYC